MAEEIELKERLKGVKKILVVRNDNLGDVLCTTPAIAALRLRFPDAYIAVLVADLTREALACNPHIDKLYSYEKAKHSEASRPVAWWRQWKVIKDIKAEGFDLAIGIRSKFSSSQGWLVFMSGAPMRVGHRPGPKDRGPLSDKFYNIFAEAESEERHEVERALHLTRIVGADIEEKKITLALDEADIKSARGFISENGLKEGKALICLHLTRRPEHGREWPVGHYIELIDALNARENIDLVLNYMPKEDDLADEIMAGVGKRPLVFRAGGLRSFAAFLSLADGFITLEGGAMHIGAAAGVRTITIFHKTSPVVWAPYGAGHIALKKNDDDAASITPEEVLSAVDKIIKDIGL